MGYRPAAPIETIAKVLLLTANAVKAYSHTRKRVAIVRIFCS